MKTTNFYFILLLLLSSKLLAADYSLKSFSLVDESTGKVIQGYEKLGDRVEIPRSIIEEKTINIKVNPSSSKVRSIVFGFNHFRPRSDSRSPFYLFPSSLRAKKYLVQGNHDISARGFSKNKGKGKSGGQLRIQVNITDGGDTGDTDEPDDDGVDDQPDDDTQPDDDEPLTKKDVFKTIVITRPGTYDFSGIHHLWKGKGRCIQKENQPPILRVSASDVVIKNFSWEGAPDGIHVHCNQQNQGNRCKAHEAVHNVKFINLKGHACEDLFTTGKYTSGIQILGGEFRPNPDKKEQDKSFQINFGKDFLIDGATFIGGKRCVRFKSGVELEVRNSVFDGCQQPLRGDTTGAYTGLKPNRTARLKSSNNTFKNCEQAAKALDKKVKFSSIGDKFKNCPRGDL